MVRVVVDRPRPALAEAGPLFINPIVYAEVSVRFSRIEELDDARPPSDYRWLALSWECCFLAGKAFLAHRRNKGTQQSTPPDFLIGAHAAVLQLELLTRDVARYRTYFPKLRLTAPGTKGAGRPAWDSSGRVGRPSPR